MQIEPPFVQLGFYFHKLGERESLARIVEACIKLGAEPTGKVLFRRPENVDKPLSNIHLEGLVIREVDTDNAAGFLRTSSDYPVGVFLRNAVGTVQNAEEQIFLSNITVEGVQHCQHPITIYTDGSMIFPEGTMSEKEQQRATDALKKIHSAFEKLVFHTSPTYAAITMEWDLPCPHDILQNDIVALTTFYLSRSDFTEGQLAEVTHLYAGAHISTIPSGILVSVDKGYQWNGSSRAWTYEENLEKTIEVSQMIHKTII